MDLKGDGHVLCQSKTIGLPDVPPGESALIETSFQVNEDNMSKYTDFHVCVRYQLRVQTMWAAVGHEVGCDELFVPFRSVRRTSIKAMMSRRGESTGDMRVIADEPHALRLGGECFDLTIDKNTATLKTLSYDGMCVIEEGASVALHRAHTDNDLGGGSTSYAHRWKVAGYPDLAYTNTDFHIQTPGKSVVVRCQGILRNPETNQVKFEVEKTFYVFNSADIIVELKLHSKDETNPPLPRVGASFKLPSELQQVGYYGRGPHENYCDRKKSAVLGVFHTTATEMFVPYLYPSECGGRSDVRWVALTNAEGKGVLFSAPEIFHFNALPHSSTELETALHPHELPATKNVHLTIDCAHMGVGGDNSWMPMVHEEYLVPPGIHVQTIYITRVQSKEQVAHMTVTASRAF
eukprot:TRINITY_DN3711_c0_g1_i2.p1 TRINITY_DN3711_c0_g1~~TRINITY_DN3711_c0_g1_i2.p1  ORF type:complete len:406 (-),score=80.91 TRINITY_DN3711_c0_g1_i2:193-1410(-)